MFRRSVVLMNPLTPDRGAFPHALELAHRLHVPVHGMEVPEWGNPAKAVPRSGREMPVPATAAGADGFPARSACARACARASVPWDWSRLGDHPVAALRQAVAPDDLLVFDQALPPGEKRELFLQAMVAPAPAVLVCPTTWSPLARALIVDQGCGSADDFLLKAARLCRQLEVETIVLTVGRSERVARRRQDEARSLLAGQGLSALFDSLIGAEVRAAVACVARWRHCQLVVLPREDSPPWWRWLRRASDDWLMNATEFASFLSLPGDSAVPTPPVGAAPPR
jgi:hypothetical protein